MLLQKRTSNSAIFRKVIVGLPWLIAATFLTACSDSESTSGTQLFEPRVLEDRNPDPDIVEVDLVAAVSEWEFRPGVRTQVWSYNGTVPGPSIEAEVGQTLVVNFTNNLPEHTTLHWHGVELPAHMDGSNISQELIPPGGQFRYEFKVLNAATHWYHPHVDTNMQVERGLYGSLLLRDANQDERINIPPAREHTLVLDDLLLAESGQIAPFATNLNQPMDPVERAEEIFNARLGNVLLVNGRELPTLEVNSGDALRLRLINPSNGRLMRLSVPGHDIRQIATDGGLLDEVRTLPPIEMISDGAGGLISSPDPDQGLLITPSERAEIILTPTGQPGELLALELHDFPYGRHRTFEQADGSIGFGDALDDGRRPPKVLMHLRIRQLTGQAALAWQPTLPLRAAPIPVIEVPDDAEAMPIFFGHAPPRPSGEIIYFAAVRDEDGLMSALNAMQAQAENPAIAGPIDGMVGPGPFEPLPFDAVTAADALEAKVGETRVWHVVNFTGSDHTFHPHGFFFQPLETIRVNLDEDSAETRVVRTPMALALKDSIRVPGRVAAGGRSWTIVRMAVEFDDTARPPELRRTPAQLEAFGKVPETQDPLDTDEGFSGGWVSHCHFNEHSDVGMMTFYNLRLPE